MTSIAETRRRLVEALIEETRATLDAGDLDRARLDSIKQKLHALSEKKELWSETDYSGPGEGERQNRFLIGQESPVGISLYLNVMRPGKKIPPHNHTTWACIAAVEGVEHNTLYDRHDDGSVEGKADVRPREAVELKPGNALAMMSDDIHSVEIRGDEVIRHLHFYGRPLETLTQRLTFDLDAGTCRIMGIGVKTKA